MGLEADAGTILKISGDWRLPTAKLQLDGERLRLLKGRSGGGVCAREENPQGQKHEILLRAKGRGERGGYDPLKGRLGSWLNACFFCAGLL
jgi:hypothetical protein